MAQDATSDMIQLFQQLFPEPYVSQMAQSPYLDAFMRSWKVEYKHEEKENVFGVARGFAVTLTFVVNGVPYRLYTGRCGELWDWPMKDGQRNGEKHDLGRDPDVFVQFAVNTLCGLFESGMKEKTYYLGDFSDYQSPDWEFLAKRNRNPKAKA